MIIKDLQSLALGLATVQTLEQRQAQWEARVRAASQASADHVRTARASVIVRARKLSTETPLSFDEVAKFLLDKTALWAEKGKPLNAIIQSLPSNLKELGIMKMSEDFDEVQRLMGRAN